MRPRPGLPALLLGLFTVSAGVGPAVPLTAASHARGDPVTKEFLAGFGQIGADELELHVWNLSSAPLEGRDSPSRGLERSAVYVERELAEAGCQPLEGESFRHTFQRTLQEPAPDGCALRVEGGEPRVFELGVDFVPVAHCEGEALGELVFCGFGIAARKERYSDLSGRSIRGDVALILEGEPRHRKRFDGPEVTRYSTLWTKLENLAEAEVAGVLVVRRPPAEDAEKPRGAPELEPAALGFRYTWATWNTEPMTRVPSELPRGLPPVLEISAACASELLGEDVLELALGRDRTGKDKKPRATGRTVFFSGETRSASVSIDNVVGVLRGSDSELAGEYVVIGAHYDHVGVDDRGRIGFGADDNASGTAALIEVAQAMAAAGPRRSVLFCAFAAEEDGLLGSEAFCGRSPVPVDAMVAMINMDMVGRGDRDEVAVLGIRHNPGLDPLLERAVKLEKTGVKKVVTGKGHDLWERSDHYSFHQVGVPSLFFLEGLPISRNEDYHTWRDTLDQLDFDKMARTSRLVFNTAWLLANDDERPPAPRD